MNAAGHFRCLFRKTVVSECTGGKPHKVEDVSVLADEPAIGLCLIRLMFGNKATEPNFTGEEMTAEKFAEEETLDESMQMGGMQL